jgi:hypothetical protein
LSEFCRPASHGPAGLISLANYRSSLSGEPCGMVIVNETWDIRELQLPLTTMQEHKSGVDFEVEVCASCFTDFLLILGTNLGFIAYRFVDWAY